MLESLITSKTRIKLILKFFLNPKSQAYLRSLANELDESTNAIRVELNRLTEAGLLETKKDGRTVMYKANEKHPLFPELHRIVMKYTGIDKLVDSIVTNLGNMESVSIVGDYAKGVDSGIIDIVIVGDIDRQYLHFLIEKTEKLIKRKIRPLILEKEEFEYAKDKLELDRAIHIWSRDAENKG